MVLATLRGQWNGWTNIESKPRVRGAQENFAVFPFREVSSEICPGSPRCFCTLNNSIGVDYEGSCGQDVLNIIRGLLNVALDIHSETGCFWDGETEVKGDAARNATKTHKDAPQIIDVVESGKIVVQDGVFESSNEN